MDRLHVIFYTYKLKNSEYYTLIVYVKINSSIQEDRMGERITSTTTSQGVQSVELAFTILNCFKEAKESLTVAELSKRMGMSKSKIHKYLVSFVRVGVLIQNKKDSSYAMGPTLIELGLVAQQQFDVVSIAAPYMVELRKQLNQSIALAIWTNDGPMVVKYEESGRPINVEIQVGFHVPLLKSATGKCFAAFMHSDHINALLQQEIVQYDLRKEEVIAELEKVRKEQLAFRDNPYSGVPGTASIAHPIFDYTGNIVAALCVIGFAGDLNTDNESEEVKSLQQTAGKISKVLS